MRDIALSLLMLITVPLSLVHTEVSLYLWIFVTYFPPQYMAYGFTRELPWSLIMSVLAVICLIIHRGPRLPLLSPITVLIVMLTLWVTYTTFVVSQFTEFALWRWDMMYKTAIMVLFITIFARTKERIQICAAIIAITMTYFAVRNTYSGLGGGLGKNVHGPGGFLTGNNEISRAFMFAAALSGFLLMTLPERLKWLLRWPLIGMVAFNCTGLLFCMSRGGWVGGIAMFLYWVMFTRYKMATLGAVALLVPLLYFLVPDYAIDRFVGISDFEEDDSSLNRLKVWAFALEVFWDQPFAGGGPVFFEMVHGRASHNAYIQMLGEHGLIGLSMWLSICVVGFATAGWLKRKTKGIKEIEWAGHLGFTIQCSFVGFLVGAVFENHGYFPIFYHMMAFIVVAKHAVDQHFAGAAELPFWKHGAKKAAPGAPVAALGGRAAE